MAVCAGIAKGAYCSACAAGRCADRPTAAEPALIPCVECGGKAVEGTPACEACDGRGHTELHDCPGTLVTPEVELFLDLAGFAEKGAWPRAGGTLDQTRSFLVAYRLYQSYLSMWEADRAKRKT